MAHTNVHTHTTDGHCDVESELVKSVKSDLYYRGGGGGGGGEGGVVLIVWWWGRG